MLMDLFYESLHICRKKRVHFHAFMLDIHERINVERKQEKGDPILPVVQALADEVRLLAFDEMVVNNTADAMILSRLFTGLIDSGVTVVATSNREVPRGVSARKAIRGLSQVHLHVTLKDFDSPTRKGGHQA